ncbi:hypothetical protein QQ045_024940 [Rhodiola kirilowii]
MELYAFASSKGNKNPGPDRQSVEAFLNKVKSAKQTKINRMDARLGYHMLYINNRSYILKDLETRRQVRFNVSPNRIFVQSCAHEDWKRITLLFERRRCAFTQDDFSSG